MDVGEGNRCRILSPLDAFDLHHFIQTFIDKNNAAGAICQFQGNVRRHTSDGTDVSWLLLEHYPQVTEQQINLFACKVANHFHLQDYAIFHKVGKLYPGESIVWVGTTGLHRREVFLACDCLMDFLKSEAFFWKKEERGDGSAHWVEPVARDYSDAQRWHEVIKD